VVGIVAGMVEQHCEGREMKRGSVNHVLLFSYMYKKK